MADAIDYYFMSASPFAYLGLKRLLMIAEANGSKVNFKPIDIAGVWAKSGSVPLGERSDVRKRYRLVELKRIALMHDICLNAEPAYFPTDPTLADRCICAIAENGRDASDFALSVGRAVWERELQIADETVLSELLTECGEDPETLFELAKSDAIEAKRQKNTQEAIDADAIGVPAYVYRGEVFWGQDRLEYLDHMIRSGRAAFTP